MSDNNRLITRGLLRKISFPLAFVFAMWVVHLINVFTNGSLRVFGIYPRSFEGLIGILTTPFIHGDFRHLISNSLPILFLMFILFLLYKRIAWQVFILLFILTGVLVWFFARPAFHIGASGIVYALVSFLFWTGIFRRNIRSIGIALAILVLYSGYFMGILPAEPGVSWESHLLGGVSGIIVAYMYKDVLEKEEIQSQKSPSYEERTKEQYFEEDTFDLTKEERKRLRNNDDDWFSSSSL